MKSQQQNRIDLVARPALVSIGSGLGVSKAVLAGLVLDVELSLGQRSRHRLNKSVAESRSIAGIGIHRCCWHCCSHRHCGCKGTSFSSPQIHSESSFPVKTILFYQFFNLFLLKNSSAKDFLPKTQIKKPQNPRGKTQGKFFPHF